MHRGTAFASFAVALGALAACNAIAGLDGEFGVDNAAVDPSPEGGASSGSSGASGNTTSSSGTSSGTTSSSGTSGTSSTSSSGADAGKDAGKACAGIFCDDFSADSAGPNWGWTTSDKKPAADTTLAVEGAVGSAARHLHVVAVPGPEDDQPGVALYQDLSLPTLADGKTLKLEFDFTLGGGPMYAMLGGFQVGPDGDRREYGLALNGDSGSGCGSNNTQLCLSENDREDKPAAGVTAIMKNAMRHATVTLVRNGDNVGGSVSVGVQNPEVIHTRTENAAPDGVFGPIRIVLGGAFAGTQTSAVDLTFDNVVVTVSP